MRDFGIKAKEYDVNMISSIYQLEEEDKKALQAISMKYGMNSYLTYKYPIWRIAQWRMEIANIMDHIAANIELANSIRIEGEFYLECYRRRTTYFETAIGWCNALKDKFHEILDCIAVDVGAYNEISHLLKREINMLKGVKRRDKKVFLRSKVIYGEPENKH